MANINKPTPTEKYLLELEGLLKQAEAERDKARERFKKLRRAYKDRVSERAYLKACLRDREHIMWALMPVFEAAEGLCLGYDRNHGTHAIEHGYRQRLEEAVRIARAAMEES